MADLAARPGVEGVYFGPTSESTAPGTHVLAVHWPGYDAAVAFTTDPAAATWHSRYAEVVVTSRRAHAVLAANISRVLSAPCTEIFTGFGAAPGFLDNVRTFSVNVDAADLEGYHGSAVGEVVEPLAIGSEGEPGQAVMLVIGWDSMEKHLEEKAKPGNRKSRRPCGCSHAIHCTVVLSDSVIEAIIANIGLLREGRTAVDMVNALCSVIILRR